MTGFRDEELIKRLKQVGASIGSSVSKNTFALLVKNQEAMETNSGKIKEAKDLGVPIITVSSFLDTYFTY